MSLLEHLIEDCREANQSHAPQSAVREVMARAFAQPRAMLLAVGEPRRAGVYRLHHAPDLTIVNVVWGPGMTIKPHDHRMWATIGIYTGREDNIFWRKLEDPAACRQIEAAGAKSLCEGDVTVLGRDVIHSVTNPVRRLSGAIHVYGGDHFGAARSEWDPETLSERPYDSGATARLFEASNTALA